MKVVIIGGVAGGMTVARRLRREEKNIEIIIIDKSYHLAPSTCMLPYALNKEFNEKKIYLNNVEEFEKKYNIKVKLMNEVIEINEKEKELKIVENSSGAIYKLNYDKLVIATGTNAIKLKELENLNDNIFIFRNIKNLQRLKSKLNTNEYKDITIIGAGTIGLELCESLYSLGYNINLIEKEIQILSQYNESIIKFLTKELENKINIYTNSTIISAKLINNKIALNIKDKQILTDLVIVSIGNIPNTNFLDNSNIKMNKSRIYFC